MTTEATAPAFQRVGLGASFRLPVRGRRFLAGSAHESFPDSVPDANGMIPAFAVADPASSGLTAAVRELIDATLPASGGLLLRGLPLTGKPGFERLVADLGYPPMGYRGGIAVRRNDTGAALATSDEDPRITLSPHNEMAYLSDHPRKVFFYCETAAGEGGEVPVNDIRETGRILPEGLRAEFAERGVRYHRRLARTATAGAMGWTETFGTENKDDVAEHLAASGHVFRWGPGDELHYHYRRDAFTTHPETGERLWFNQITELHSSYWRAHPDFPADLPDHAYPATTSYGDGEPIDEDTIAFLRGLLWRTTHAVRMRPGDVLVLDNQVLQHGRFAFTGPRRHFVSLTR
ncbi:TauD/TfdA family dioxygenase [Streptomyces mobaraensis]|uniref:TauD/TfdA family dioxygenase n=1 Tax=Streptomyces mobaraensis TaxID=35621 RepID=UPI0033F6511D